MSINSVNISGNLARDCETRETNSGTTIISFTVCVNDRKRNAQTGEWEDEPNYIDCKRFCTSDKQANFMTHSLLKGAKVAVSGRLSYDQWSDRVTGKTRSRIEVIANEVEVMSRSGNSGNSGSDDSEYIKANTRKDPPKKGNAPADDAYDADIPF